MVLPQDSHIAKFKILARNIMDDIQNMFIQQIQSQQIQETGSLRCHKMTLPYLLA